MATAETTQVEMAIENSIREQRSVTLTARMDSVRWVALTQALDGHPDLDDTVGPDTRREYLGTDENGDHWTVVLTAGDEGEALIGIADEEI